MPVDGPRYYYLGPWVETEEDGVLVYNRPGGALGSVDLRGSSGGVGFFVTGAELADPAYTLLGTSLSDPVDRGAWQDILPVTIEPGSILDALWDTVTIHADPDGVVMCPPLRPRINGRIELHIGGHSLVRARRWQGEADPAWPKVRARLQSDYRKIRAHALRTGSGDRTVHQRVLAMWQQKYGVQDEAKFIPRDLPIERARKPETIRTDDFNRADGAIGSSAEGWAWASKQGANEWTIESNQAHTVSGSAYAEAQTGLSSDDMYVQAAISKGANTDYAGVLARLNTGTAVLGDANGYAYEGRCNSTNLRLSKIVAGSVTTLDTTSNASFANGNVIYLECDSDTITLKDLTTLVTITQTDMSVSGYVRGGMTAWVADWSFDDFEEADLAAAAGSPWYYYAQLM